MARNVTLLVASVVLVSATVAGVAAALTDPSPRSNDAHTCATLNLGSDRLLLVVAIEEADGGVSSSQQILQTDDRTRVTITVEFGDESLAVSGESTGNGTLALDVAQNGTVVEDFVVSPAETDGVVFRVDGDRTVRVERNATAAETWECGRGTDFEESRLNEEGR